MNQIINPKAHGVAVFVEYKDCLLVNLRTGCWDRNGFLQCPGGTIEEGESAVDAAEREIFEETGLELFERKELLFVSIGVGTTETGDLHVTHFYKLKLAECLVKLIENKEPEKHGNWVFCPISVLKESKSAIIPLMKVAIKDHYKEK